MRISLRELLIVVALAALGLVALKYATITMQAIAQVMVGVLLLAFFVRAMVDRGPRQAFAVGFVGCALVYAVARYVDGTSTTFTGVFGTTRILTSIHPFFVATTWTNEDGRKARDLPASAPPDARQVLRLERVEPSGGRVAESEIISSTTSSSPSRSEFVRRQLETGEFVGVGELGGDISEIVDAGFGGGGGRGRGRGRRGGRGQGMSFDTGSLNEEQLRDFNDTRNAARTQELLEILTTDAGRRMAASGAMPSSLRMVTYTRQTTPSIAAFRTVGYCLFTLLVGYLGGHFARFVYLRRPLEKST